MAGRYTYNNQSIRKRLKYFSKKQWELDGIYIDLDDESLDKEGKSGANERQKLIFLLKKREKDLEKRLGQLNDDVNYVMRSNLTRVGQQKKKTPADLQKS